MAESDLPPTQIRSSTTVVSIEEQHRHERREMPGCSAEADRQPSCDVTNPSRRATDASWYQVLFENSPDAMVLIDPHDSNVVWPIIDCNDAYCRMNGYTRDELIGESFDIVHQYRSSPEALAAYLARLRQVGTVQEQTTHRRKDGTLFPIEYSASLIVVDGRELALGIDRDITARRAIEAALNRANDELETRVIQRTAELSEANVRLQASVEELNELQLDLRHSEERYRSLVAATPQFVFVASPEGQLISDMPDWRAFTGQTEAELLGGGWVTAIHPDDRDRTTRTWEAAVARRGRYEAEYRIRSRDGDYRYINACAVPVFEADGTIREWVGVYSDITYRRQTEEAMQLLVKASALLASSLDYPTTLSSVARLAVPELADWCLVDVVEGNEVHRIEVAHADPGKVSVAQALKLYPPRLDRSAGIAMVLRTGRPLLHSRIPDDYVAQTAIDPQHAALMYSMDPRSLLIVPLVVRGRVLGAVTMVNSTGSQPYNPKDLELAQELAQRAGLAVEQARLYKEAQTEILERTLVEMELREQTETLATINRIGQLLSAELDLEKLVQAVTDAATELTGAQFGAFFYNLINEHGESYTLYTLSGIPRETFANFPMPRNTHVFGPTFRGEGIIRLADVQRDPRYGQNAPYHGMPPGHLPVRGYLAVPVTSRSGEVLGGLFFGHPETDVFSERDEQIVVGLAAQAAIAMDNARLYKQAQEALHARDQFLSIAAHELKTPITAIVGYAQVLEQRARREGNVSERNLRALHTLSDQALRLSRLIHGLLDISRLQIGQLTLECGIVDLHKLVQRIVEEIGETTTRHQLSFHCSEHQLLIDGDAVRLEQVVQNLLQNAMKYSPEGGPVEVDITRQDHEAIVSVRDHGIGIPTEALSRLFNRFFRAENATRTAIGGMGVGLHVVKEVVALHGGSVAVESTEGKGSTFTVRLPLYQPAE
jgi:PAS domain S-box-containing protein